jgi:hypothetical protein
MTNSKLLLVIQTLAEDETTTLCLNVGNPVTWRRIVDKWNVPKPAQFLPLVAFKYYQSFFKPLTKELNLSAQRCLTRFFTGDFAY